MKKLIAFDLDGTLNPSKSPLPDPIAAGLNRLLDNYMVCVISGGKFLQFERQLLANLPAEPQKLKRLHLMPTCGTRYYRFNESAEKWEKIYAEDLTSAQKLKISSTLEKAIDELGYREKKIYGELIEDRGSQLTLSLLGQDIVDVLGEKGVAIKEAWDPDNSKKNRIRQYAAPLLEEFEVRVGGLTSIDVTRPGIDKAYGMQKLVELLGITKEEILFIGDRLGEGGNDYPVKAMGIDCIEISDWRGTALVIETLLAVS